MRINTDDYLTIAQAAARRQGRVVAKVVADRKAETLQPVVQQHVANDATLYTDACTGYSGLGENFVHDFVDHAETYVRGAVHTNGMENFWALLKRALKGTHVSVEPFHLFRYVDAEAFRFNERALNDGGRLVQALKGIGGKRLTYKGLIGEDIAGCVLSSDSVAENENLDA